MALHPFRRPALALVAALLAPGCASDESGTVGDPKASEARVNDTTAPLVKGGQEQPAVKVKGKSVSAREAAGLGR